MKKNILTAAVLFAALSAASQELELTPQEQLQQNVETLDQAVAKLRKLKVSGYIQTQYQYGQAYADSKYFKLANAANSVERNDPDNTNFGRLGIRRGRIKFTYEEGIVQGVFQPDITDKGVAFKDVYLAVKDPWIGTNSLKAGIFDRPFGHEIAYSSSRRESPERARMVQDLFPDERDLGAMLTLQPAKTSAWNILKLEAGLFAGNGICPETDSRLDFIGHLSVSKTFGNSMLIGGGVSAYIGGVLQTDSSRYKMDGNAWVLDGTKGDYVNKFAPRQYFGVDFQFAAITAAGQTQLRAEYIMGKHPGNKNSAYDFKPTALYSDPLYMRNISGGYVILTQDIPKLPLTAIVKYDWYDKNTDVSGDDVKSKGDLLYSTVGVGLLWNIMPALKLTAYFDFVGNETSNNLAGYEGNYRDNVFTLRLQYKF